jgi:hypothetical protein
MPILRDEQMPEVPTKQACSEDGSQGHWALAVNPETPGHVLKQLAVINLVTDKFEAAVTGELAASTIRVLERIAEHANADAETLSRLAQHSSSIVRGAVAGNTAAPTQLIVDMSTDESVDVRYVIAETPTAPLPVLERLTQDDNPFVSHRAMKTIKRVTGSHPACALPECAKPRAEQLA